MAKGKSQKRSSPEARRDHSGVAFVGRVREGADQSFDLFEPTNGVPELYVDGNVGMMVGPNTSKVSFFSTFDIIAGDDGVIEQRRVVLRMVIPTRALVEFCAKTLASLSATRSQLVAALDAERAQVIAWTGGAQEGTGSSHEREKS